MPSERTGSNYGKGWRSGGEVEKEKEFAEELRKTFEEIEEGRGNSLKLS
ncbi:hypothetical protein bthur0007_43250 [Bacillus thuringiensis serovar monterrey BGSC 4AJ1]|nr:hypothetical protein bthur0007_43250 [Bacillus thuringiensis serovar monterrey BGSC 4AJ1]